MHLSMNMAAALTYMFIGAIILLFGFRYLLAKSFMPYHSIAVGKKWEELDSRLQATIRAMLTVVGGGMLASGIIGIVMSFLLMNTEKTYFVWLIPSLYLLHGVPTLYATVTLKRLTGAPTPVVPSVISLALTIIGIVLSIA